MLSMGSAGRWFLVLLLALAAGIAAFFGSRSLMTAEDPPLPPATAAIQPAVVPDLRPDVRLADRDGKMRALSEWNGRPAIINFWATWCAPCRREIPMLNALSHDPSYAEFALIGIAIDFREDVLSYLTRTPIDYTVLIGEQDGLDAARAFGMESIGLPFTVFTDSRNRIVTIHVGELHRPQAEVILSAVHEIDAGQIDLKTAQAQIRAQMPKIG
jgi:thiol-disulfide isomerase/thioredoxin